MKADFLKKVWEVHQKSEFLPSHSSISTFIDNVLALLFPQLSEKRFISIEQLENHALQVEANLQEILEKISASNHIDVERVIFHFHNQIPKVYDFLQSDAYSIAKGDPAAHNMSEVIRTYPGFYAIAVYRIAHLFYNSGVPFLPRILTEFAHQKTGIDINPGAKIGRSFCIDHGTGLVIGETAVIGNNVKIYQGVTLGALSVNKEMAKTKRHPTICDNVVIYSGATILGGNTIVGANSIIGGNVWLIKSVPDYSRVYHRSQIDISYAEDQNEIVYKKMIPEPISLLKKIV